MNALLWQHEGITITLTTESPGTHYGIPVLRVEGHPAGAAALGPADLAPFVEGETPGTAAQLLMSVHKARPLTGEALEGARQFLGQWQEGPQLESEVILPAEVRIHLSPSILLTAKQGLPVLINRADMSTAYGPADLIEAYNQPPQPAAHLVVRLARVAHLSEREREFVRQFLAQWKEGPQLAVRQQELSGGLIPGALMPSILAAVKALVEEHGHPDEVPVGSLASKGIPPEVAEACEALLTSEDFPEDPGPATAKWIRLIGEFSE
jgi:hypothetical protein